MNTFVSRMWLFCLLVFIGCTPTHDEGNHAMGGELHPLDLDKLKQAVGMKGMEQSGEFKVTVPQNDLQVSVDDFKVIPPMGLGSWAAFTPSPHGAMVMGDIIVTENDLRPVEAEVISQGLTITAIHNHFLRDKPDVMYMHIGGMGAEDTLGRKVRAVFDKVAEVRGHDPASAPADSVQNTLDTKMLDNIIGSSGAMSHGVYKYTIGRPDVRLTDHGSPVSTFMGFNTWASWQGSPEHAAVAGDFTMLTEEVAPVIQALVQNGIEVVALHNHMVMEEPRIFFLHYWGVGKATDLAHGLKAALDRTGNEKKGVKE